ncbi:MAG: hypothetical protein Q7K11_01545 [Candidatus Berkelbacteria bacterium]|nr:hypothetical protein [Candidatus Berkelbacteria bacterium]
MVYFILRILTPNSILINANQCTTIAADLFRKGVPRYFLIMGGFQDPRVCLGTITKGQVFLLGGTEKEQEKLQEQLQDLEIIKLTPSSSTLDEIQKAISIVKQYDESLGILVHEMLCVRATCTSIKEVQKSGKHFRIVPLPCLDYGRETLSPILKGLATLIEAWKLWKYQRKGDVATLSELIEYVRWTQTAYK